jgi:hypothetical protein
MLFKDTLAEFSAPVPGSCPKPLLVGFCLASLTISSLNYYWFMLMIKSLVRIYLRGQSWSQASADKTE